MEEIRVLGVIIHVKQGHLVDLGLHGQGERMGARGKEAENAAEDDGGHLASWPEAAWATSLVVNQ